VLQKLSQQVVVGVMGSMAIKHIMGRSCEQHGMAKTRQYRIWSGIKQRCFNKNTRNYQIYGKQGVTMCSEWRNSFVHFWEDMKDGYDDTLSIDRIDNTKGYSKENCEWSTPAEQARNMRDNIFVEYKGKSMLFADWSKELGIPYWAIRHRILVQKETPEEAFENHPRKWTPQRPILQRDLDGVVVKEWASIADIVRKFNVSRNTISRCINGKQKTSCGFSWEPKE